MTEVDAPLRVQAEVAELVRSALSWLVELPQRPWLLTTLLSTAVVSVAVAQAAASAVLRWRHRRLVQGAHEIDLLPPPEVDPAGVTAWWSHLTGLLSPSPWRRRLLGVPHVAVEYRWSGRQMRIVIWVPGTVPIRPVAAAATAAWPGATASVRDAAPPLPVGTSADRQAGTALVPALRPGTRWRRTTTPTRSAQWWLRAPASTAPSRRACRSWPGPPHRGSFAACAPVPRRCGPVDLCTDPCQRSSFCSA